MNVNKAMIVGRVTRDPEMRTTPSGQNVTSFGVATNRVYTDAQKQKQEQTEFHNVVAWGKLAEICGQYLVRGQEVFIEGRMQTRTWDAPDGTKKNRTEIVAENMQMGVKPRGFTPTTSNQQPTTNPSEPVVGSSTLVASSEEINVEEIPF